MNTKISETAIHSMDYYKNGYIGNFDKKIAMGVAQGILIKLKKTIL